MSFFINDFYLLLFLIFGIAILIVPQGISGRYLAICFFLPLLTYKQQKPQFGEMMFTLLDVGQGLAVVIRTKEHTLVYDTGPAFNKGFNAGSRVILPYLAFEGIKKIDLLVISHGDNDHIGGAKPILKHLPVKKILSSVPERFPANLASHCVQGQHWKWDGVRFIILSPTFNNNLKNNNNSCVLKIETHNHTLLLPGDIEKAKEKMLVNKKKKYLKSNILVAPHHGSDTSSTYDFIQAVLPQYVLYATGYNNRFHFPAVDVIKRYENINTKQYNTANTGAITFLINDRNKLKPLLYRKEHHHVWNKQS